jgi:hypothetical protein
VTQYTIDYEGFHCDRERGDFGWSDEVYAITSTVSIIRPDGSNNVRTEKHPFDRLEYGDVDAGETRLGPVARCWQGLEFPVSLTVVAFERDHGDPDVYRDEVDDLVKAGIAALAYWNITGAVAIFLLEELGDFITDGINWLLDTDDDQVDIARTQVFDQLGLEAMGRDGPRRHIHHFDLFGQEHSVVTELDCHFFSKHSGGGGRYVFGFNVGRTPPFVEAEPIVD